MQKRMQRRMQSWKQLNGKKQRVKTYQRIFSKKKAILAKISKIWRYSLKSGESDIFHFLRNLLKYLLRTIFVFREVFRSVYLCVFTLWLFLAEEKRRRTKRARKRIMGKRTERMRMIRSPPPKSAISPDLGAIS